MRTYKIFSQKMFENTDKFEERLNDIAKKGWEVVSSSMTQGGKVCLVLVKSNPR